MTDGFDRSLPIRVQVPVYGVALFSNSIPPIIAYTAIQTIDLLVKSNSLRKKLFDNTQYFRKNIKKLGFNIKEGIHPIIPIMIKDAILSKNLASDLLKEGIYVISFSYPVVPKGEARIRVQISASHTKTQLDKALNAFKKIGKDYTIIN